MKHWDQDDEFEFTGAHLACREGYDELPTQLAKGLDVRLNTAANAVHYNTDGGIINVTAVLCDGCRLSC